MIATGHHIDPGGGKGSDFLTRGAKATGGIVDIHHHRTEAMHAAQDGHLLPHDIAPASTHHIATEKKFHAPTIHLPFTVDLYHDPIARESIHLIGKYHSSVLIRLF
jgi:hypothetical protein